MVEAQSDEFQAGRRFILEETRRNIYKLKTMMTEQAAVLMSDCMVYENMGQASEDGNDQQKMNAGILRHAVESCVEQSFERLSDALSALQQGRSLPELLRKASIPTYKAVINGDYAAGVVSGADDVMVLVLSMGADDIIQAVRQDVASIGELEADMQPVLERLAPYIISVFRDSVIAKFYEGALKNNPVPRTIQREGEAPRKRGPLSVMGLWLAENARPHHTMRVSRRGQKLGTLWPPLYGNGDAVDTQIRRSVPDTASFHMPKVNLSIFQKFNNMAAQTGYVEVMYRFFHAFQAAHFAAVDSKKYAAHLKLASVQDAKVVAIARDLFSGVRDKVMHHVQDEDVVIEGGFCDGVARAVRDIKYDMNEAFARSSHGDDNFSQKVLERLKSRWVEILNGVLHHLAQEGPSHIPDSAAPVVAPA
ncbi:MAG: hypothetical protein LRY76_03880 [Alphaproteobacteria bacterium]|nr:hypothetical protein [Alphaproteobacteria bacterium]